jgi:hypothetical protein
VGDGGSRAQAGLGLGRAVRAASQTALVPILLQGLPGQTLGLAGAAADMLRPWDNGEFSRPEDPRQADD